MGVTVDYGGTGGSTVAPARRRFRLNVVTGLILGIALAVVAALVANAVTGSAYATAAAAFTLWPVGFLGGMGAMAYPFRWAFGRSDPTEEEELKLAGKGDGISRYFRYTTDHKVVGIQYLWLVFTLLAVGGIAAMLIRLNLIQPGSKALSPWDYNTIVGFHGLAMIAATIIMISGPFGNFVVPIMIGARDMAFPRLNALSFWLAFSAIPVLLMSFALGGFSTGWTLYAPLATEGELGVVAINFGLILFILSLLVSAVNIVTTVITLRTKGMNWARLPALVWAVFLSVLLGLVVMPSFEASQIFTITDQVFGTVLFTPANGGSAWLYENLFWFMGHPEVYVIAIPAFGVIADIIPVFTRKPLFGRPLIIGGMIGVTVISLFVWAHHLFVSGMAPGLVAPFMLTTELISIPTGLIFLAIVGTLWKGRIWTELPLMWVFAFVFNFLIGGITGIYLADAPSDIGLHGTMFVTAHFHYTLMGGMLMEFFAAVYFWFPKMFGRKLDKKLGLVHFWVTQICFNVAFLAMFYSGLQGMPRRVASYASFLTPANVVTSLFAFGIGVGMCVFGYNVFRSLRHGELAGNNPWGSKTLEWQVPTPVPLENFTGDLPVITGDPYGYGEPEQPVAVATVATDGEA